MAKQSEQMQKKTVKPRKKNTQNIPSGIAHVKATFNNTIVSITDPAGHVISWASAGKVNFSGSRKSSAFAATVAAQDAGRGAASVGMREVEVVVAGIKSSGRPDLALVVNQLFADCKVLA